MKHALRTPAPDALAARRLVLVEQQLAALSRSHVALTRELSTAQGLVRRRDAQLAALWQRLAVAGLVIGRLLLANTALARAARPVPLDTGTPGVEVSPR